MPTRHSRSRLNFAAIHLKLCVGVQELFLWSLSRPRDSLPSVSNTDEDEASDKTGTEKVSVGSKPLDKASVGKAAKDASDFISAARGPDLMNGTADSPKAGDRGSDRPVAWKAPIAKGQPPGAPGVRRLDSVSGSGHGARGSNSGRGVKPASNIHSPASEDSSAALASNVPLVAIDRSCCTRTLCKQNDASLQGA